jgi:hypothetical protein
VTGGRRRPRRLKVVLAALMLAGSMSFLTISGTYAIFTSQEGNAGATTASGTLTMTDSVNGGTACTSYTTGATGNVNAACTALFSTATLQYPGSTYSVNVAIADTGSLPASKLSLYMPTCTKTTSPSAPFSNGGNPCLEITEGSSLDGVQMTVEEMTNNTYTTVLGCYYPVVATGACSAAAGYALNIPNSFGIFAENLTSSASAYALGTGPVAGATRYFKITLLLPSTASNTLQGQAASFDLTWHLTT